MLSIYLDCSPDLNDRLPSSNTISRHAYLANKKLLAKQRDHDGSLGLKVQFRFPVSLRSVIKIYKLFYCALLMCLCPLQWFSRHQRLNLWWLLGNLYSEETSVTFWVKLANLPEICEASAYSTCESLNSALSSCTMIVLQIFVKLHAGLGEPCKQSE